MKEKNEINQQLSSDPRVRFAAERTLLAWIRTGLSMMGFGFVVARFGLFLKELSQVSKVIPIDHSPGASSSLWIGTALILLGVLVNFNAVREHIKWLHSNPDLSSSSKVPTGVITAGVLGIIGILMAIRLINLV